jgi:hypothetical protein
MPLEGSVVCLPVNRSLRITPLAASTTRMVPLLSTAIPKGVGELALLATRPPQDAALLPVPARTADASSRVNELAGDEDVAAGLGRDAGVLGT